jgi:hypothetical protein
LRPGMQGPVRGFSRFEFCEKVRVAESIKGG